MENFLKTKLEEIYSHIEEALIQGNYKFVKYDDKTLSLEIDGNIYRFYISGEYYSLFQLDDTIKNCLKLKDNLADEVAIGQLLNEIIAEKSVDLRKAYLEKKIESLQNELKNL